MLLLSIVVFWVVIVGGYQYFEGMYPTFVL
jgi:hypothetical protein